ncbi:Plant invertase/pectin methylesterase inhibitor superfamily protein [Trifolium repens]|nr:Plant invertase/pectin methylesterase inhibitor superfamily protein [Trifolium repens]
MDYTFNKTLLVILSLSSLLLSSNAVPSTRVNDFIPTSAPAEAPIAEDPDEGDPDDFPDAPSSDHYFCKNYPDDKICQKVPINMKLVDPEIIKTCNGEPYGSLVPDCIEILYKNFEGRPFDVVEALDIQVNSTGNTIKEIYVNILANIKGLRLEKNEAEALDICRHQYEMMLDSINQILEMLRQQNFVDAYQKMDALLLNRNTCTYAFADITRVPSPWDHEMLWYLIDDLGQMVHICVNILSNIVNNHKL